MSFKLGFTMTDDALVTFGAPVPGGVSFHDKGFIPVISETINGYTFPTPAGTTEFIAYDATGVQHFSATGQPTTADYTKLHYTVYAGLGNGSFGHAADGTPIYSGMKDIVKVADGDLVEGQLAFTPTGGITGQITTTANFAGQHVGQLSLFVQHAATDLGHTQTGGLTLSGGNISGSFG